MRLFWILCLTCGAAYTQTGEASPTFDAASMKLSPPLTPTSLIVFGVGGPGTTSPGRIQWQYASLMNLLLLAYDVKSFQISGPEWIGNTRYDISAAIPENATKEQFHLMLRNLLAERLHLKLHRAQQESVLYSLTVAKGGPKLKELPPETAPAPAASPPAGKRDEEGFLVLPSARGAYVTMNGGRLRIRAAQETMEHFAGLLSANVLRHPVTDDTGLTGKYDFIVTFTDPEVTGQSAVSDVGADPDIFAAMQQIGLKLERKKGMIDTLVIDRVEKIPTEN